MVRVLPSLFAICAVLDLALAACLSTPKATTLNGTYTGVRIREFDQEAFWGGVKSAASYGALCPTTPNPTAFADAGFTYSDDCLNLNILRPARTAPGDKLPVAVWIHGGSFSAGFGPDGNTNTSYVVKASMENELPIITITLNYRLGFLGFPGGPDATAAGITNLGLKDQHLALRWIRENIAAFGGDPDKVTLWGQSAGAMSITHQLLAYGGNGASGLFRGAIAVSGTGGLGTNSLTPDEVRVSQAYDTVLNLTSCANAADRLDCLREVDYKALYDVGQQASAAAGLAPLWWPSVDGDFITESPSLLAAGRFPRDINFISGTNSDEGLLVAQLLQQSFGPIEDDATLLFILGALFFPAARPEVLQKILDAYPVDAPSPPYSLPMKAASGEDVFCDAMKAAGQLCGAQYRRTAAIFGDFQIINGRRFFAESLAKQGVDVFTYRYVLVCNTADSKTDSVRFDTNPTSIPISSILTPGFTAHSTEYTYFFNLPPGYNMYGMNPQVVNISSHLELSRGIVDKLVSYIATGDPNTFNVDFIPKWPTYDLASPKNMLLNATESDNQLNVRLEPDTWRAEGMALWPQYPIELDLGSTWRPQM
ncbi:acetylcholinesterase [Verticillium dahliae]|nr:acetylcholinesterase [Verticillium dahliae]